MMGTKQSWAALCIALLASPVATGADSQSVGPLGYPAKLVIKGAEAFTPEAIREALFNEIDVVAASDPANPLANLPSVIADKAAAGYRGAGFFDVKVSLATSDDKLVMTIQEGDRYTNGEIEVSGNRQLDADKIKARLTKPQPDGLHRRPLWRADEAAAFGPESETRLTLKALTAVNEQGCYRARLKATVDADRATKRATLRINISDEGPRATLDDGEFVGNERNHREAVVAYLDVDTHAPLTRELREQVERRLRASGRFLRVDWELGKPEQRGDSWRPRLAVEEYDLAPPVDKSITREEAALLKAAEWVEQLEQSDEEVLVEQEGKDNVLVFAPRRGFIATFKTGNAGAVANDEPGFDYAIVLNEDRVGLYSGSQHGKLVAQPPPSPITGEAIIQVIDGAPNFSGESEVISTVGLSTDTHKVHHRHINIQCKLTAPAALSVVRKHKAKSRWDGDVVSFQWDKCQLRINALTGQVVDHLVKTDAVEGDAGSRLAVVHGEFERRLAEIERITADWPNLADAQRPVSCVGEFFSRELEHLYAKLRRGVSDQVSELYPDEDDDPLQLGLQKELRQDIAVSLSESYDNQRRGYAAFAKAISLGLLEPADKLAGHMDRIWHDDFQIPRPQFYVHSGSLAEFQVLLRELAPLFGVRLGNKLFSPDSRMSSAWRLGVLAVAKKPIPFPKNLDGPLSGQYGPLSALLAAELLRAAGDEFQSTMYACSTGPDPATAFREECREFVSGEGLMSELLLNVAGIMHQIEADDIEALLQLFVEFGLLDQAQAAALELAALRAQAEDSPEPAAAKALDALWRAGLSSWVERRLKELRRPPGMPRGK
jgi:hypothetical protein